MSAIAASPNNPDEQSTLDAALSYLRRGWSVINNSLTRLAGAMRRHGVTPETIEQALLSENAARCDPPLEETEVRGIARSIAHYPPGNPGLLTSQTHSPAYREEVPGERILRFKTGREIASEIPAEVPWVARPWVALGAITEVDGKVKSAGKTTWVTYLVRAVLDGVPFMGEPTAQTSVVYLTEQSLTTFRAAMQRARLLDRDDFIVLFWYEALGIGWPEIVRAAAAECRLRGAKVLVVDTLGQFADLTGDSENDAGRALEAMKPIQQAAAEGLAVIIVRHERKSGGSVGDAGRGSSAFAGAADIVLSLRRPEGNHRPTIREIVALSRLDETPAQMFIELTQEGYRVLGKVADLARQEAEVAILETLPTERENALSQDDLLREIKEKTGLEIKKTTAGEVLKLLRGRIGHLGAGKKGDPYKYYLPRPTGDDDKIHSPGTSTPIPGERISRAPAGPDGPSGDMADAVTPPTSPARLEGTPVTEADLPAIRDRPAGKPDSSGSRPIRASDLLRQDDEDYAGGYYPPVTHDA